MPPDFLQKAFSIEFFGKIDSEKNAKNLHSK